MKISVSDDDSGAWCKVLNKVPVYGGSEGDDGKDGLSPLCPLLTVIRRQDIDWTTQNI